MQLSSSASVTILRAGQCVDGTPYLACAGLCGSLCVWTQQGSEWVLALEVSTAFKLARGRTSSHPFKFVVTEFDFIAAASTDPSHGAVTVYTAKTHATVKELAVLRPSQVVNGERFSISCVDMNAQHVAAGSREGSIVTWQMDDTCVVGHSWSVRVDEGPVAALALAGKAVDVIVAAYRQPDGSVDGAPFHMGEQSVAAWRLSTGVLLWRQRLARDPLPPTLGLLLPLLGSGSDNLSAVWLLHAHSAHADADWPWLPDAPEGHTEADERRDEGSTEELLRAPLEEVPQAGEHAVRMLHGARARRRVLAWDMVVGEMAHDAGHGARPGAAVTFEAGYVAFITLATPHDGSSSAPADGECTPDDGASDFAAAPAAASAAVATTLWGRAADGADMGAVCLLRRGHADLAASMAAVARGDAASPVLLLTGSASAQVMAWAADGARRALSPLLCVPAPLQSVCSVVPIASTDYESGGAIACGGADGRIVCLPFPTAWPTPLHAEMGQAHPGAAAGEEAAVAAGKVASTAATGDGVASPDQHRPFFEGLHFSTGAAGASTFSVRERREMFDGWARTAAFERGLTDLLLGRTSGRPGGGDASGGGVSGRKGTGGVQAAVVVASSGGGSGGAKSGGSGAAKVGDGAGESAHARPARQRLPDWVLVEWSRHVLRRNRAWPRAAGQLPLPALACRSQVVRVRGLLSDAEVEAVLALAATLPFARKHAASARTTCYLSTAGRFRTQLPVVRAKILDCARRVDARRWELLAGREAVVPRCVECHALGTGSDILHPGHYDFGSLLTVDVMLSRPAADFAGGAFLTKERDGSVRSHFFDRGDAVVFVSHKPHFVAPVVSGERKVLIVELWEGQERTCPHRCESRVGPCFATPTRRRSSGGGEAAATGMPSSGVAAERV